MASNYLVYLLDSQDLVKSQGALTASTEDALYPVANLKTTPVSLPWRSSLGQVGSQYIRIDFPVPVLIDTVALIGHNLTQIAALYVNGGTNPDPDGSEFNYVVWPEPRTAWARFDEQTFRYWKIGIDDPTNSNGFLQAGRLLVGLSTQLTVGFQNGDLLTDDIFERSFHTEMGVPRIGEPISEALRWRCDFIDLPLVDADEIRWWLRGLHGRRKPIFVIPNPSQQPAFYGRLVSTVAKEGSRDSEAFDSIVGVEFQEDHAGLVVTEPLFLANDGDLNEWDAGDELGHFERASVAYYKNSSLELVQAAVDVARQLHYDSIGAAGLLVEPSRTNGYAYSDSIADAVTATEVNLTEVTASADATASPLSGVNADKLVESTANSTHEAQFQCPDPATDNTVQSFSIFLKAAERTQVVVLAIDKASASNNFTLNLTTGALGSIPAFFSAVEVEQYVSGWWRLKIAFDSASGVGSPRIDIRINSGSAYTGDGSSGAYFWGWQWEVDREWPSSYIHCAGTPTTRSVDLAWLTATFAPRTMTFYLRFIEIGEYHASSQELGLLVMGNATGARLQISQASAVKTLHDNSSSTVSSLIPVASVRADLVEVLALVNSDGSVQTMQRNNGGSPQIATESAALAFPGNWGAPGPLRLGFTISGSPVGCLIQRVKLANGINTDFDSLAS